MGITLTSLFVVGEKVALWHRICLAAANIRFDHHVFAWEEEVENNNFLGNDY